MQKTNLGQLLLAAIHLRLDKTAPDLLALTPPWAALGELEREAWNHAVEQIAAGNGLAVRERAAELLEEYAARSTKHGSDEWLLFGEATEEMRALRIPGADELAIDPSVH
jgi:hypothetical protein